MLGVGEGKPRLGFSCGEKTVSKPQIRVSLLASGSAAPSESLLGSGKQIRQMENGRWRFPRDWYLRKNSPVLKNFSSFLNLVGR